jgi:aldose 1-epimerase
MLPANTQSPRYVAEKVTADGQGVVRLVDHEAAAQLLIAPGFGNNSYDFRVNGKPVLWSPYASLAEAVAHPTYLGNPFLAPWANRIDGETYYANSRQYRLNPALANYRTDGFHQPIHGLVAYTSAWRLVCLCADENGATATSQLEFWRYPEWMAQFPFAHTLTMTYRLSEGAVEVITQVENLSEEPMPLSLGFHPYFRVNDSERDTWRVHLPVRSHVELSPTLVPTGRLAPSPYARPQSLEGIQLDDVFTGLEANADGLTEFVLEGAAERVRVLFGSQYKVAVVYAPAGKDFVCFEPMTGPTNVFNLAHRGHWPELPTIAPGGTWQESFWIRTEGF